MTAIVSRRRLLQGAGLGALTLAVGAGTTSCRSSSSQASSAGRNDAVLPSYVDPKYTRPDLASKIAGGSDAYFRYPENPVQVFDSPPVSGAPVSALGYTYDPVAPSLSSNPMWQSINKAIGAPVELVYAPVADYTARFATTIAGGDLPDLVNIVQPVQSLPDLLQAKFTDLTDFVSGDNVLRWKNLAALPTDSWRNAVVNSRVWGVPAASTPIGLVNFLRADIAEAKGLPSAPRTYAEFTALLEGLTDERKSTWATADRGGTLNAVLSGYGVPGGWFEQNGTLTYASERPEYQAALADVVALSKKGVFHPDASASSNNQRNEWFTNGTIGIVYAGFGGWNKFVSWGADVSGFKLGAMLPFSHDGSIKAVNTPARSALGFTAIAKADQAKVERLLSVLDWLVSPFGTREHMLRTYGLKGVDHTMRGSDPIYTSAGDNQRLVPFGYLVDSRQALYDPGAPEAARARFEYQESIMPMTAKDPLVGLYSRTAASKGAQLDTILTTARGDILNGRKPVSSWAEAMDTWRSRGGDKIRAEYEAALAQSQGK